ncbi:zinc finger CCCH domain-containing protein [Trifolium repens]|nr:zinc finger CCCH domain-containing protein [Trifolium repens]
MLSRVKFIPRDQVQDDDLDSVSKDRKKLDSRSKKDKKKGKSSRNRNISSDEDELVKIKKGSRKKKWYSSDENSSFYTSESESGRDDKKQRRRKGKKKKGKKEYTSEEDSSSSDGSDGGKHQKSRTKDGSRENKIKGEAIDMAANSTSEKDIARKEMGLDWMLRSDSKRPAVSETKEILPEEVPVEESKKANPRELNPYLKDDGTGYPEESDEVKVGASQLLSSSVVGDGGASWRLKALKRAQEQAAREGRSFQEVVGERWGSLGELTASVASKAAAPARAHLRAIKSRQRGVTEENSPDYDKHIRRDSKKDYIRNASHRHREMKAPKVQDSLSWRKRKNQSVGAEGAEIIAAAASSLNKFANDGSFMRELVSKESGNSDGSVLESFEVEKVSSDVNTPGERNAVVQNKMSANQLAAKAMQLRLKGKNEEADKLMEEAKVLNTKQGNEDHANRSRTDGSSRRYAMQRISAEQKKGEDDSDMHLARNIMQNKQFKVSTQADDEYDFEDGPSRKSRKKQGGDDPKNNQKKMNANRFLTQKERCLFCLENPNRPMHLVVSIANFTYLMLPQWQPVVPGHCCILPIHHESATRTVEDNVWVEIRNFKKCLIMMFAKQDKEAIFLETVMGLAQQRRHCMVECIPLPKDIAKEAPLYFKKAIDEAEDEWSQHNAKRLIDTSEKGLRNSIPKDFPYFHVEFGLNKGFVHVIDDEKEFKSNLGLNVIRGMLHLAEEDMYRRQRYEKVEVQKQAVASFSKDWGHFDWTKQLHET